MFTSSRRRGTLRSIGKNYMYRQTPTDIGFNAEAQPVTTSETSAPINQPPSVIKIRLLICLYDDSNCEHVSAVQSCVRSDVEFLPLNMTTPIYNLQAEIKMTLWRLLSTQSSATVIKRLSHVGFVVYPLLSNDELECILNNLLPTIRAYFCFTSGQTHMPLTLFTITPPDASLMARVTVLNETLQLSTLVICLSTTCVSAGASAAGVCTTCATLISQARNEFFLADIIFESLVNISNIVEQLERKLICLGNLKGLLVSSKMQNIFNRMLYIEDRYRKLQGNIMTDTCYDGMLGEIEHIESKIKDISLQIPLSYTEGYELINKLTSTSSATACNNGEDAPLPQCPCPAPQVVADASGGTCTNRTTTEATTKTTTTAAPITTKTISDNAIDDTSFSVMQSSVVEED